ncbi:MAG: MBL fold metallo-hydrolase [Erysipelotrichaceae bacterium]|jgi:glyoxylase-like metal-dependent hydrolase (beta-lactamase superfamily II)|nr:MBL fold metallo-hydrolase [Erysipelotrichaceae bacterium]
MQFETITYSKDFSSNTYLIFKDNAVIIIDPGHDSDALYWRLKKADLKVAAILLTHTHYDHFNGIGFFKKDDVPLYLHHLDEIGLSDPTYNASILDEDLKRAGRVVEIDYPHMMTVQDQDELELLGIKIKVLHTPFHTKGSVCYYLEDAKVLYTGDTLFKNSIGRFDLAASEPRKASTSLEILKRLPDEVIIYPGHGAKSTIGDEKQFNRYFKVR